MTATGFPCASIPNSVPFAKNASLAVAIGDLLYLVTDDVRPVSGQADGGTLAANQAAAAPLFAGVAGQAALAADGALTDFQVLTDVIVDIDCSSATFEVGDKVTFVEDSGGTYLENQKVVKTSDETLAIGYAVKRYGSATTRVRVRLISRIAPNTAGGDTSSEFTTVTTPVLIFNGATGANEIRVPTNLADALSIESSAGDIVVLDTTTGTVVWTFSAAVRVNVAGDAQIGSATTDLVGFHGSTPTDQCAAYTQTFSTADRTHANPTATVLTLTNMDDGSANNTLVAIGDTMAGNESSNIEQNFDKIGDEVNFLIADLADVKALVNSIIDDLQEKGLVG